MDLGIREDFSSNVILDSELVAIPSTGLYLNSGVHPSLTLENLLSFLPKLEFTVSAWSNSVNYGVFAQSNNKKDLVSKGGKIYQSIKIGINQDPETESEYWLETNIESLRLKAFINTVKDRVYSDLNLTKKLVNNQYLYEVGNQTFDLPNDYAAWVFEPKGSDYTSIRINEISLQKNSTDPVNVYIVNQGKLIETLTVTPDNGAVKFQQLDYTMTGKGKWYVVIDSTEVIKGNGFIDPLKYDGFTVSMATGSGNAPESATYNYSTTGNGLGFNITAFFDGAQYINNNTNEFGNFIRATFELMVFQMFLHNSNNVTNRQQRIQMNDDLLLAELKRMDADSVISRYYKQLKREKTQLEKTFDTQLSEDEGLEITVSSI